MGCSINTKHVLYMAVGDMLLAAESSERASPVRGAKRGGGLRGVPRARASRHADVRPGEEQCAGGAHRKVRARGTQATEGR